MDYIVRSSVLEDEYQLRALWTAVFGDGDEFLNPFFNAFFSPGSVLVCESSDKIIASVYPLPIGSLLLENGCRIPCVMIYALGTMPQYRGLGCASALVNACCQSGAVYVLRPANEKLFKFYEKLGFKTCFYYSNKTFTFDELKLCTDSSAVPLTPEEYNKKRNSILSGNSYIEYNENAVNFENFLCKGQMFELSSDVFSAVCTVEKYLDTAYIKELLVPPEYYNEAVAAAARAVKAGKYYVRSFNLGSGAPAEPFGMAKGEILPEFPAWYGFAFD